MKSLFYKSCCYESGIVYVLFSFKVEHSILVVSSTCINVTVSQAETYWVNVMLVMFHLSMYVRML